MDPSFQAVHVVVLSLMAGLCADLRGRGKGKIVAYLKATIKAAAKVGPCYCTSKKGSLKVRTHGWPPVLLCLKTACDPGTEWSQSRRR
jgi:hypothetical protein